MSLLVESCQIADGAMDYTKQLKRKRNYRFVKKTETVAITYQNFFLLYPKLSGMTGTGKTAEVEFEKFIIYQLRRSQQLVQIKEKICQI
jgi:preprotein translocase subunit SecA